MENLCGRIAAANQGCKRGLPVLASRLHSSRRRDIVLTNLIALDASKISSLALRAYRQKESPQSSLWRVTVYSS